MKMFNLQQLRTPLFKLQCAWATPNINTYPNPTTCILNLLNNGAFKLGNKITLFSLKDLQILKHKRTKYKIYHIWGYTTEFNQVCR